MLLGEFISVSKAKLEALYPSGEAASIISILCEERLGVKSYAHIVEPGLLVNENKLEHLQDDVSRLCSGEPVQYVVGKAWFCGRRFNVSPSVLIPRPETEWLAQQATQAAGAGKRALDLCTGSGCIAWTVALDAPGTDVTAVDISPEAVTVASMQFSNALIRWELADILSNDFNPGCGCFDVLTANPPYVMDSEKALMRRNVLQYEPQIALFVPDSNPLLFYRSIARIASEALAVGGRGFVEINENLANESAEFFSVQGLAEVQVIKDYRGKNRFVTFLKA